MERGSSIALGSKGPRQVARNSFRTRFGNTSPSTQSFRWRCAQGKHPFPSRTRRLRLKRPMVLHWRRCGRAGGCQIKMGLQLSWLERTPDKREVDGSSPFKPISLKRIRLFKWGCSSVGRAPALQAGGHEFESHHLHSVETPIEH